MKEEIVRKVQVKMGAEERLNTLREELHHLLLQEVDRKQGFEDLCFLGGTALRILYHLDRFSEDLDFSTSEGGKKPFLLKTLAQSIQKSLEAFGFDCRIEKLKIIRAVHSCFFAFYDILHKIDSSFPSNQKLLIKFEVDTHPPKGAKEQMSPVTGTRLYKVRHYNLPSLFAGKLHAILYREYTKGRDLYDFLWYTSQNIRANKVLLENAIEQTQKKKIKLDNTKLQEMLKEKFRETSFEVARKDVARFLINQEALNLFDKALFLDAVFKVRFE